MKLTRQKKAGTTKTAMHEETLCEAITESATPTTRTIHHADAIGWLTGQEKFVGSSIITSLPDISEFPKLNLQEWKTWFINAAALVMSRCSDDGITIFYQTDIKVDGEWVDKGYLCQKAAAAEGHTLIAHKIVCRATPGTTRYGRPAYSHMLAFSKCIRPEVAKSLPDVLPLAGESSWTRGMGDKACALACKMVKTYTSSHTVVDPFCGHGLVLAFAYKAGLNAIGVDHSLKCVKKARAAISN